MVSLLLGLIYIAFISLGLPDSLLGAAWPSMYTEFDVPLSYAGGISMIISLGTIVSSLQSDRLTRRFGTGKVMIVSVGLTAAALLGFSCSHSFLALCFLAVPYGLGAGSVDASLNNYVALHYASRHMSWLHCMWGVGAMTGPYIMGYALGAGYGWNTGYRYVGFLQVILTILLFCSLPLWKKSRSDGATTEKNPPALTLGAIFAIPGAKSVMLCFFCYCALEQTAGLWAGSYLMIHRGISAETAAIFSSLFFVGITTGRAVGGFITMRFDDRQMVRMGQGIIFLGLLFLILPLPGLAALLGLVLIGLGCAPVYPCLIHSTPAHFGTEKSQAVIGVQMASAYVGTCLMPPLFGLAASLLSVATFPFFLLAVLIVMAWMYRTLVNQTSV